MSFADPKIHYKDIRDNILTLFKSNKAALNVGLTSGETFTKDSQIQPGDPEFKPIFQGRYPFIMMEFMGKEEEDRGVGASHTKLPVILYRAYCLIRVMKNSEDIDAEIMNLLDNVEALIRQNINGVAGTAWIVPGSSEKISGKIKGVYVAVAALELRVVTEVS